MKFFDSSIDKILFHLLLYFFFFLQVYFWVYVCEWLLSVLKRKILSFVKIQTFSFLILKFIQFQYYYFDFFFFFVHSNSKYICKIFRNLRELFENDFITSIIWNVLALQRWQHINWDIFVATERNSMNNSHCVRQYFLTFKFQYINGNCALNCLILCQHVNIFSVFFFSA